MVGLLAALWIGVGPLSALALMDTASEKPAIRLAIDAPQTDRLYGVSAVRVK
ncbi:MAG: hypothetical protein NTY19_32465 [Planctomycetota bacterium]|nr:hypothetical protein [Planctomycetota bacterium]